MPDYVAHATTVGGRNGHVETNDGLLKADLSIPKSIGDLAKQVPAILNNSLQPVTRPALADRLNTRRILKR
jgi:hypothetical protein